MSGKRILIVAAHPDDEAVGCGGTVALHSRAEDYVTAVIVCEGESLRYGDKGIGMRSHTVKASQKLGIKDIRMLGFPDHRLESIPLTEIISQLEQVVREVRPSIIYCQYGGDLNADHQVVFKALLVATRPIEEYIEAIYAFDTASSTEWAYPRTFSPDTWIDISSTLNVKLEAVSCYESEARDYPHPRSLRGLDNRARAWGNQSCLDAAEAFMTVRRVLRNGQTPG